MMGFGSELKAHAWRSIPRVATVQRASLATPQSLSSSSRRFDWLTRFCVCSHSIRNHPRILLFLMASSRVMARTRARVLAVRLIGIAECCVVFVRRRGCRSVKRPESCTAMILAEPLISYLATSHGVWCVTIADIAGRVPDRDDIDWLAWRQEMRDAVLMLGMFGPERTLLIVHPPGYGT